jgi:hypothetical protein
MMILKMLHFNSISPDGNANSYHFSAAGSELFKFLFEQAAIVARKWTCILTGPFHANRRKQSTIVKLLVCGSGDTNTAQNRGFPFAELTCWFQPGIQSISEMLEDKYIVYDVSDMLEASSRYGRC